jgi:hypothetical protein
MTIITTILLAISLVCNFLLVAFYTERERKTIRLLENVVNEGGKEESWPVYLRSGKVS